MALLSEVIQNTPESILEGRIYYQFKLYGGLTIILIEIKLEIRGFIDHLNVWARSLPGMTVYYIQIAASRKPIHLLSIACCWVNSQAGFGVPILTILCDGKSLYVYRFDEKRDKTSRFLRGKFGHDQFEIQLPQGSTIKLNHHDLLTRIVACPRFYTTYSLSDM